MSSTQDIFNNFKIPRVNNVVSDESQYKVASILEDSYENQSNTSSRYKINPAATAQNGTQRPNPVPPSPQKVEDKPETKQNTVLTYKDSFPKVVDTTLPQELTDQFHPLSCKLCDNTFNNVVVAKTHYFSKNHQKKVRKFLMDYSERTGEPLHELAQPNKRAKLDSEVEDKYFYCSACDLPLTGKLHAESHYMGKNHQKVISNRGKPSGPGFYDADYNWVRRTSGPSNHSGGDTFGMAFKNKTEDAVNADAPVANDNLTCSICKVNSTSFDQLQAHLNGEKHRKQMQKIELIKGGLKGIAAYKTPSGLFYCNICNFTLNSELQFTQHLNSKKHAKKSANSKND